jgi:hypothetical protein
MNQPEGWPTEISDEVIRIIALQYGFKLKEQSSGENDLNPYVYSFARKLINMASEQNAVAPTPPANERNPYQSDDYRANIAECLKIENPTPPALEQADWEDEPVGFVNQADLDNIVMDQAGNIMFVSKNRTPSKPIALYTRFEPNTSDTDKQSPG